MVKGIKLELSVDDKGSDAIKKFGKNTAKAFGKMGDRAKKLAKTMGSIASSMAKIGAGAAVAGLALGGKAIKASIGEYADFEKSLVNVSTLVDTSKVSMEALKKGIMDLPPELGSAKENMDALYQAISAGVEPAKAIGFVGEAAKAAKAGLTDTFTAVDAGTTVLNAFGMESSKATQIYDQMFMAVKQGKTTFGELAGTIGKLAPIASAASVSTQEMFASISTLTAGGFATGEAVSRMTTALGAIVKPSKEASDLSAELGLKFDAQALKARGLAGFLDSVKAATGGNIEKMAQLFGGMESLSVMLALTGEQSDKFKENLTGMGAAAGSVDDAFKKQSDTLSALWETFKNSIGKQSIMLGEELAPAIKGVIKDVSGWIKNNKELIKTNIVEFAKGLAEAIKWGKENFEKFLPVLKAGWTLIKGVAKAFDWVGKAIGTAIAKVVIFAEKLANSKVGKVVGSLLGGKEGGYVPGFQSGGAISGYGGGDRVKAMLEPGEFVMRKEAVRNFGMDFFKTLNNMGGASSPAGQGVNTGQGKGDISITVNPGVAETPSGEDEFARKLARQIEILQARGVN